MVLETGQQDCIMYLYSIVNLSAENEVCPTATPMTGRGSQARRERIVYIRTWSPERVRQPAEYRVQPQPVPVGLTDHSGSCW